MSRTLLFLALVAACLVVTSADSHAAPAATHDTRSAPKQGLSDEAAAPPAVEEVVAPFSAMQYGILIIFVIMWMVYYFLYFFEFNSAGNSYLFSSSYIVLVILIASGLSRYFTASILTGILASTILGTIAFAGFAVMMTVSTPDRFEGDKSNMGRTRLEN